VLALLDDRRARSSLLLGLTRRFAYTPKRQRQAFHYLDGLFLRAEEEAQAAWPGKQPCPDCGGGPASGAKSVQRPIGHGLV
jgi:hypothetical protein